MAQEGVEPSASLLLEEGGLPVAYRAIRRLSRRHLLDPDARPEVRTFRGFSSAQKERGAMPFAEID